MYKQLEEFFKEYIECKDINKRNKLLRQINFISKVLLERAEQKEEK